VPPCSRILLVETDEDLNRTLAELLGSEQIELCADKTFDEALTALRSECVPSLVLVDLPQPPGRTLELIGQLEREPRLKDVPVVVVTSLPTQVVPRARAVLVKPFSVDALLDALRPCLPVEDHPGGAGSHSSP
jgi:CheY-like chemotaxis protein